MMRWPAWRTLLGALLALLFLAVVAQILFTSAPPRPAVDPGLGAREERKARRGKARRPVDDSDASGKERRGPFEGGSREDGPTDGGLAIEGRVVGPDGAPVGGAWVVLLRVEEVTTADLQRLASAPPGTRPSFAREILESHRKAEDEATTRPDGEFRFRSDPSLSHVVVATKESGPEARPSAVSELMAPRAGDTARGGTPQTEIVLELALEDGLEISGRVLGGDGAPVAGAQVSARLDIRDRHNAEALPFEPAGVRDLIRLGEAWRRRKDVTGDDGAFRLRGLLAGTYSIEARSETHSGAQGIGEAPGIRSGESGVEIRLLSAALVRGKVHLPDGQPVSWASVLFFDAEEWREPAGSGLTRPLGDYDWQTFRPEDHAWGVLGPGNGQRTRPKESGPTRDDGTFAEILRPGAYHVAVQGRGIQTLIVRGLWLESSTKEPLDLAVEPGRHLSGRVVGEGERPLPEVPVLLASEVRNAVAGDGGPGDRDWIRLVTDSGGRFSSDRLRPVRYHLRIPPSDRYAEHAQWVETADLVEPIDLGRPGAAELVIALVEAPVVVRGRAVDDATGDPVAGARVAFRAASPDAAPRPPRPESTTAGDGRFAFRRTESGAGDVVVEAEGYEPESTKEFWFDPAKPPVEIEVRLRRERVSWIEGLVRAADGTAIPGARVTSTILRSFPSGRFENVPGSAASSGKDGAFRLSIAVLRGDTGGAGEIVGASLEAEHPEYVLPAPVELKLQPGQVRDGAAIRAVELVLERGARISGTVRSKSVPSEPIAGATVSALRLLAAPHTDGATGFTPAVEIPTAPGAISAAEASTDHRGRFELRGLREGAYVLRAEARGFAAGDTEPLELAWGEEAARDVELPDELTISGVVRGGDGTPIPGATIDAKLEEAEAGEPRAPTRLDVAAAAESGRDGLYRLGGLVGGIYRIDARASGHAGAVLERVSAGTQDANIVLLRIASLRVVVRDLVTGAPLRGISVELLPDSADLRVLEPPQISEHTGVAGVAWAHSITPGPYRLRVMARGYIPHESAIAVSPGEEGEVVVRLDGGEGIAGVVVDERGAPIGGVKVVAFRPQAGRGQPAGTPQREAGMPKDTALPAEESSPPDGVAPAPLGIVGPGPGADPEAAPDAEPEPDPDADRGPRPGQLVADDLPQARTDSSGAFRVSGLEHGAWRLVARHRLYRTAVSEPLVVIAGKGVASAGGGEAPESPPPPVRIVMRDGTTVRGKVLGPEGAPVRSGWVELRSPSERRSAEVDGEGRFEIRGASGGAHTLCYVRWHTFPSEVKVPIDIRPDETEVERDLVLGGK